MSDPERVAPEESLADRLHHSKHAGRLVRRGEDFCRNFSVSDWLDLSGEEAKLLPFIVALRLAQECRAKRSDRVRELEAQIAAGIRDIVDAIRTFRAGIAGEDDKRRSAEEDVLQKFYVAARAELVVNDDTARIRMLENAIHQLITRGLINAREAGRMSRDPNTVELVLTAEDLGGWLDIWQPQLCPEFFESTEPIDIPIEPENT